MTGKKNNKKKITQGNKNELEMKMNEKYDDTKQEVTESSS